MRKQLFSGLLVVALGMSLVWVGTAPAQTAPAVPPTVNIEDPDGDSNGLNDQGLGGATGYQGDNSGGASIGATDILKVWFTNDADTISTHILTTFPPPNNTPGFGLIYRVMFNPDSDTSEGCIWLEGIVPSNTYVGEPSARVWFACETKDAIAGEIAIAELEDGTGITSLTFPRGSEPAFADDAVLTAPRASTRVISGGDAAPRRPTAPQLDNTMQGTDYTVSTGTEPKKCPSKGKKKGKTKPKPRPTTSPSPTSAPTTPPPGPEMMFQTPTPTATAKPTGPPGQDKPCPRQQGKNKPKPRPRPTEATPAPSPTPTDF